MTIEGVIMVPVSTGTLSKFRVGDMRDALEALDGVAQDGEWFVIYPEHIQYDRLEDQP